MTPEAWQACAPGVTTLCGSMRRCAIVSQAGLELAAEALVDGAELADPVISADGRLVA